MAIKAAVTTHPTIALHRPICPEGWSARNAVCENPCAERARPFVLAATILAGYSAALWTAALCAALAALIAYRFLRQPRGPAAATRVTAPGR